MEKKVVRTERVKTIDNRTLVVEYYSDGSWKVVRIEPSSSKRKVNVWRKVLRVVP